MKYRQIYFFAAMLCLSACASVGSFLSSPTGQAVVTDAVTVAVEVAEGQGVPAAEIATICSTALAADASPAASLATVDQAINKTLSSLNVADKAALSTVEIALNAAIGAKLAANPSVAQVQAAASDVFSACVAATK